MDAQREADTVRRQIASALGCAYIVGRQLPLPEYGAWTFGAWDMAAGRPVVINARRRTNRVTGSVTRDLYYDVSPRFDDLGYIAPPPKPHRWSLPVLVVQPQRAALAFCVLLLLAVMGDRHPPRAQAAPPRPVAMHQAFVAILPAALVEPPVAALAAPEVSPPSDDEIAVTRAYHAVLAAFPAGARRELDRAQHTWLSDRNRACTAHATGSRAHCLHLLATHRVAELTELLARASN
jgi:hypothetical protein